MHSAKKRARFDKDLDGCDSRPRSTTKIPMQDLDVKLK